MDAMSQDLKDILGRLKYTDDAKVVQQITEQMKAVKNRMAGIRHKLVVMSGKGGVGKSMTTVNLALAFARQGDQVGVLDVDLNGPCVPKMLGMRGRRFAMTADGAMPPVGPLGVKVGSMDFFLEELAPVQWKGPMDLSPVWLGLTEMNVIREFIADIVWGSLYVGVCRALAGWFRRRLGRSANPRTLFLFRAEMVIEGLDLHDELFPGHRIELQKLRPEDRVLLLSFIFK